MADTPKTAFATDAASQADAQRVQDVAKPAELLDGFDNPQPQRPYTIFIEQVEFTSMCPKTGQPDFGTIRVWYQPASRCVELKSFKFYLQAFRNRGIFYEAVTNQIADDLATFLQPRWLRVESDWKPRGGITTKVEVEVGQRATVDVG